MKEFIPKNFFIASFGLSYDTSSVQVFKKLVKLTCEYQAPTQTPNTTLTQTVAKN